MHATYHLSGYEFGNQRKVNQAFLCFDGFLLEENKLLWRLKTIQSDKLLASFPAKIRQSLLQEPGGSTLGYTGTCWVKGWRCNCYRKRRLRVTSHLILRGQFSLLGFVIEVYTWSKKGAITSTFDTAGGHGCLLVVNSLEEEIWYLLVFKQLGLFCQVNSLCCCRNNGPASSYSQPANELQKEKKKNHKKSNQQKKPKTQPTLLACFLHHLSSIKKDKRGGTSKKIWVFDSKRTLLLTKVTAYSLKANCTFLLLAISFWCWNTVSCFFQDNTYRTYRLKIIISQIALYIWVLIQCRDAYSTQTEVKVKGFKKRKYSVLYYMSSGFS